ncbi:hypothetical protein jhhlp_006088 [Lomentospora prolificans]|uniref:Pseudouridine synthase RsuA/RluA-like domain-containing protein n=1 Tax=Lomentospora prolificans TaxID=41688 RepID=A0A2N3N4Z2_9PEZI|nr:hypothetical protein jhhlp_006088 [Lomentospora prolificans]
MSNIPAADTAVAAVVATPDDAAVDSGSGLVTTPLPPIASLSLVESEQPTEPVATLSPSEDPASAPPANKTKPKTKKRKLKNPPQYPNNTSVLITPCDPWPRPYYFEDGLRKVAPYFYTYNTFCKERWRGRKLVDIYTSEFRDRPPEYYVRAIDNGTVMVNGKAVGLDYVMRNNDLVTHTLHRHEPPVSGEPVKVLHEDEGMLVIVKPAGIPVHPAGRYGYNSVLEILKDERGPGFMPHPCHRLDRLTSGIMFIAKNPEAAEGLRAQIAGRTVRKEYIARVIGEFPDGEVVCDQPILQISPKLGLNRVRANGKSARTVFQRLAYYPPRGSGGGAAAPDVGDSTPAGGAEPAPVEGRPWVGKKGYSIVRCLPITGRTHQIRVHLQYLGYPIQNDPIYANQKVWGFKLGSGDSDGMEHADEDIISRLERMGKEEAADAVAYHDEMVDEYNKRRAEMMTGKNCEVCDAPLYTDPGDQELSLWLHSLRYQDADGAWGYVTPLPKWALPPQGVEGPTEVGNLDSLIAAAKAAPAMDLS